MTTAELTLYIKKEALNLGFESWGLISARLGKKSNLKELKERLWWADDGVTLKRYYEGEIPDWGKARQNFRMALKAVQEAQKKIAWVQALPREQESAIEAQAKAHTRDEKARDT